MAEATLLIGGLVNVTVIEAVGGVRAGVVDEHRLGDAWAHVYGLVVENAR